MQKVVKHIGLVCKTEEQKIFPYGEEVSAILVILWCTKELRVMTMWKNH